MSEILSWAERAWRGELTETAVTPTSTMVGLVELAPGLGFVAAFANAAAVATEEGLVLIDTSSMFHAHAVFESVRRFSQAPLHTAVYTHGHVDHVFGLPPFEREAQEQGRSIRVLAHRACRDRFDRYRLTAGYNGVINARQFGFPVPIFPTEYRYPDELVDQDRTLSLGGLDIHLHHDRGETDDHLWAHIPSADAIYTGDLFIWASPNCGNPQKAQRYPRDWAHALRKMARLDVAILMPGHGPPIVGRDRVRQALDETASLLESLVEQTLRLLNQGAPLDVVLAEVRVPAELLVRPYLRPSYDDPQFIVRNLYRLYAGWWDGNPAHLKPAPEAEVAHELATLAGGAKVLAERAELLLAQGHLALAGHLIELAYRAARSDTGIGEIYQRINLARAEAETSLMARAIFRAAARGAAPGERT
ncbi:MAG: MBL fold metallo-hydrolase [Myxococcales bacterium]|nr:MBL fold metallo-hydrolase [Myxococcales bacterium]